MIKKIIFSILRFLLLGLTKLNLSSFMSSTLSFLILRNTSHNSTKLGVLVFEKPRFITDTEGLKKYTDLNPIIIRMKISVILGKIFLPEEVRGQHKYHYQSTKKNEEKKLKYRFFLKKILPRLFEKLNIKAILVGNMDYWEHQEWSWVAEELNIPTVVLYRESVGWDERNIKLKEHYSSLDHKLPISKLAVFGPETKKWLEKTNLIPENNIVVTGAPRTDTYYKFLTNSKKENQRELVVLFDFISQKYSSSVTPIEVLTEFINLSNNTKNYKFLIKTKEEVYKKALLEKISEIGIPYNNLSIQSDYKFENILNEAKLIIGYMRSTAMLESMIAKVPIILPIWGDLFDEDNEIKNDENTSGHIYKITKKEDFQITIKNLLSMENIKITEDFLKTREKYIYKNLYKIDGKSSERLANLIKDSILNKP